MPHKGLSTRLFLAGVSLYWGTVAALGQELPGPRENAWLQTWISSSCCVTNNCCYRVTKGEAVAIGGGMFRVTATGQVLPRTDWSQDGELWLCACDYIDGKWTVHPKAHARCVFQPRPSM